MNCKTAGWAAQMSPGSRILIHTVRAWHGRGKRPSGELAKSPCQGAVQVIPGIRVRAGKTWAAATKQICHPIHGCPSSQQLFSDPLVGDAPIGARESLWNPQPLQPSLVNGGGLHGGAGRRDHPLAGAWPGSGDGAGSAAYLLFRGFYQHSPAARQARLSVQEPHPGSVPVALAPEGFLVVSTKVLGFGSQSYLRPIWICGALSYDATFLKRRPERFHALLEDRLGVLTRAAE